MAEPERPVNEQAIQAALDYANNIIDTLRHPFLVLDGDLRVKSANRSFYRTFQVSPEETLGQRVYDLGSGQWNIACLRALLEEILPQNTIVEDFEFEHTFPTIGKRYVLINARRIHRELNHTNLILLGIEDISDRRQSEEQRQEIEIRFTSLVKNVKDHAIFTLDTNGRISSWNVEAERILGYSEAEALGQDFSLIFAADDIARGRPEEELRVAQEKGRAEDERWHKKKNGELFWALGIVTPMHDARGKHVGFSKILRDMTDRRQMEELLRQAQFRAMFELASAGMCQADIVTGKLELVNDTFSRMTGYPVEELVGRTLLEIIHPEDRETSGKGLQQLLDGEIANYEVEKRFVRKDGTEFWGLVAVNLVPNGGSHRTVALILDVTNRKQAEAALVEGDRRKNEFLAMLSHELRNPLAPILSAVQLMGAEGRDSQHCDVIERQVRHLKRLVDDLLEVSRIATGRIHLQLSRINLNEVIAQAAERMRTLIEEHSQELLLSLPQQPIWVHADAARLEQVFGNLLGNASKFSEVGGHIWMTVERTDDQVVVRVRDDGMGMAPDFLPHIFDLFAQADKSLDRSSYGGLGVGLTLVKNLIEQHSGTVEAFSDGIGRGSEFVVRLPTTSESKAEPTPVPSQSPLDQTDSLRILVVDDQAITAEMISMLLQTCGHEVQVAYNGPDALRLAADFQPQMILLDIGLPEINGYEVARHLRQDSRTNTAYLVAITGYGQEEDRQRSKEAGFDVHLVKPVEFDDLKKLLADFRPPTTN
ncbi:MAG: PAS domain S-box protein [Pirellulaceae bacterium]